MSTLAFLRASVVAVTAIACASASQNSAADRDLAGLVRSLIVDSANGAGRSTTQVFVAADSVSVQLMRFADVQISPATEVACPGSSDVKGGVVSAVLGYKVKIGVSGEGNTREVSLVKSCTFIYRGRARGFAEGTDFELSRENHHWRVKRRLRSFIT